MSTPLRTREGEAHPGPGRHHGLDPVSNRAGVDRAGFLVDKVDIESVFPGPAARSAAAATKGVGDVGDLKLVAVLVEQ